MSDYTPTIEEVREIYARNATDDHTLKGYYRRRAGFDGWLASVQAEAWNAGFADGVNYDLGDWDSAPSPITNPYQDSQSS